MYNVNIMNNGRKKKKFQIVLNLFLLHVWGGSRIRLAWGVVVGRGGEGSSPGEILGNGISNAQSQEQIYARNVSFENNSQWPINIINSVKNFFVILHWIAAL